MRRIAAAAILTLMIIGIGLSGRILTEKSINYVQTSMHSIDISLSNGDTHKATQECRAFLEHWDKQHGLLCMFLQHEHLDPIENILAVLPFYIEQDEIILARAECRTLISITEHIRKTEQITLENIL